MSGEEAIERLDEVEAGAFGEVARRHLGSSDVPDLSTAHRALGVVEQADGEMELLDDPSAIALREAIMAPRATDDAPPCGPWFARE